MTYEKISAYYKRGLWVASQVKRAVTKGVITQEQCDTILAQTRLN